MQVWCNGLELEVDKWLNITTLNLHCEEDNEGKSHSTNYHPTLL